MKSFQKCLNRFSFNGFPFKNGKGTWQHTLIWKKCLKSFIDIMRQLILLVLSIVQQIASSRIQVNSHISTCAANVFDRFHQTVELVNWLILRLSTDIYAHAVRWVQELAEATKEVQVRVNLFIIQVFHCKDKVDCRILIYESVIHVRKALIFFCEMSSI